MINRVPPWLLGGAFWLALCAGIVNVVGLMGFQHQAVTHLTGNTSLLGEALAAADFRTALHFWLLIVSFVVGAMISGMIIQDSSFKLGRRYSVALVLVAALLFAAIPLMTKHIPLGWYAAACACGLQNAMVSTYSGATVRTAHLTGMFTDLGIFLGHYLRRVPVDPRRVRLSLFVIGGFLCGGVLGAYLFTRFAYEALVVPAVFSLCAALAYVVLRRMGSTII